MKGTFFNESWKGVVIHPRPVPPDGYRAVTRMLKARSEAEVWINHLSETNDLIFIAERVGSMITGYTLWAKSLKEA